MASASSSCVVGIDLGGTSIRATVGDIDGRLHGTVRCATLAYEGRDAVIERIIGLGQQAIAESGITPTAISSWAVGVPGPMDPRRGIVYTPPNLPGWRDVPLAAIMRQRVGCPVYLNNDANLGALGEHIYGAGRGCHHLIYLTISTGIGGGIILDDRLFIGPDGSAAEVGHMTVDVHGPRCNCGNIGCVEALASGTAIGQQMAELLRTGQAHGSSLAASPPDQITGAHVVAAALAGDAVARQVLASAMHALGLAVVTLVNLFNPELVIIGGGVSNAGDLLFDPIRAAVHAHAMPTPAERVRIIPTALGDDVGLYGAVALAQRRAQGDAIDL